MSYVFWSNWRTPIPCTSISKSLRGKVSDWDEEINTKNQLGELKMILNLIESRGKREILRYNYFKKRFWQARKNSIKWLQWCLLPKLGSLRISESLLWIRKILEHLLTFKFRIMCIKGTAIPWLEFLGSWLSNKHEFSKKDTIKGIRTDLQIISAWIGGEKKEFQTFIEDIVQEMRKLNNLKHWFYCSTRKNPPYL